MLKIQSEQRGFDAAKHINISTVYRSEWIWQHNKRKSKENETNKNILGEKVEWIFLVLHHERTSAR